METRQETNILDSVAFENLSLGASGPVNITSVPSPRTQPNSIESEYNFGEDRDVQEGLSSSYFASINLDIHSRTRESGAFPPNMPRTNSTWTPPTITFAGTQEVRILTSAHVPYRSAYGNPEWKNSPAADQSMGQDSDEKPYGNMEVDNSSPVVSVRNGILSNSVALNNRGGPGSDLPGTQAQVSDMTFLWAELERTQHLFREAVDPPSILNVGLPEQRPNSRRHLGSTPLYFTYSPTLCNQF